MDEAVENSKHDLLFSALALLKSPEARLLVAYHLASLASSFPAKDLFLASEFFSVSSSPQPGSRSAASLPAGPHNRIRLASITATTTAAPNSAAARMVGHMVRALAASAIAVVAMGLSAEATHTGPVAVDIGSHTHLADATALVNKNRVMHSNNVAVTKSNVLVRQDDTLTLEADAGEQRTPAEEVVETGEKEALQAMGEEEAYGYRHRFYYSYGSGYRYGWRYPIAYWNMYGPRYFGPSCGYGRAYGGYYYC